jgi:hypothetical protein
MLIYQRVYDRTHTHIYISVLARMTMGWILLISYISSQVLNTPSIWLVKTPMCFHVFFMCYLDSIEKTWKHIGVLLIVMCFYVYMFILILSLLIGFMNVLFFSYAPKSALHVLFIAYPSNAACCHHFILRGIPSSRSQVDEVWTNRENRWCVKLSPWKPRTPSFCGLTRHVCWLNISFIRFQSICSTCRTNRKFPLFVGLWVNYDGQIWLTIEWLNQAKFKPTICISFSWGHHGFSIFVFFIC